MAQPIPESHRDLLDKKAFGYVATIMKDGSPQVTPIWFDCVDGYIRINSAKGRVKDKNMRRDPNVAFSIADPDNPYRHLSIRGRVVEITEEGADDHIDQLAKTYMGVDRYPLRKEGEIRVTYRIEPISCSTMG